MSAMRERALAAALAVARDHGLDPAGHEVLHDHWNLVVRVGPVVLRVATVTGQVRAGRIEALLRQEVALVEHLAAAGAPAVRPPAAMPAGPFRQDGFWLVAMAPVEHDPQGVKTPAALGRSLRQLHEALATYPGRVPALSPLAEVGPVLAALPLAPADRAPIEAALAMRLPTAGAQPLHGDSHRKNVLLGPAGPVWIDFEEVGAAPVGWDLACLLRTMSGPERAEALAAYGSTPPDLPLWLEARALVVLVWSLHMAHERGTDAGAELAAWKARYTV